ncbi:MAG: RNA polymerase sigma factor [Acutalibacteraceae bacterium]
MEDERIVALYQERDENAIRETSDKYGVRLRAVSYRITGDRETSEECENDTYLQAWNRIPPSDPKAYFYAFLARITRALSIDRCRRRARLKRDGHLVELTRELEICIPAADDVANEVEAKRLGEAISRFLYTLSEEKQIIFIRRYFYLDAISEIARRLFVGESKVKTTLFRIRKELRDYLIKEGYTL